MAGSGSNFQKNVLKNNRISIMIVEGITNETESNKLANASDDRVIYLSQTEEQRQHKPD